jgi:hypothetical protein
MNFSNLTEGNIVEIRRACGSESRASFMCGGHHSRSLSHHQLNALTFFQRFELTAAPRFRRRDRIVYHAMEGRRRLLKARMRHLLFLLIRREIVIFRCP